MNLNEFFDSNNVNSVLAENGEIGHKSSDQNKPERAIQVATRAGKQAAREAVSDGNTEIPMLTRYEWWRETTGDLDASESEMQAAFETGYQEQLHRQEARHVKTTERKPRMQKPSAGHESPHPYQGRMVGEDDSDDEGPDMGVIYNKISSLATQHARQGRKLKDPAGSLKKTYDLDDAGADWAADNYQKAYDQAKAELRDEDSDAWREKTAAKRDGRHYHESVQEGRHEKPWQEAERDAETIQQDAQAITDPADREEFIKLAQAFYRHQRKMGKMRSGSVDYTSSRKEASRLFDRMEAIRGRYIDESAQSGDVSGAAKEIHQALFTGSIGKAHSKKHFVDQVMKSHGIGPADRSKVIKMVRKLGYTGSLEESTTTKAKKWKQTSMSAADAIKKYGKENVKVKKGGLNSGEDQVDVFVESVVSEGKGESTSSAYQAGVADGRAGRTNPRASEIYGPGHNDYQQGVSVGRKQGEQERAQRATKDQDEQAAFDAMSVQELQKRKKEIEDRSEEISKIYDRLRGSSFSFDPKKHQPENHAELKAEKQALNAEYQRVHRALSNKGVTESDAQKASRYHPDTKTYRGMRNKMPHLDDDDPVNTAGGFGDFDDQEFAYDPIQGAEQGMDQSRLRKKISRVIKDLTDREQQVLNLRFGLDGNEPQTLEQVGKVFGVSREVIRQVEAKALRKLRHPNRTGELAAHMDESVNEDFGTIALGVAGGLLLLKFLKFGVKKVIGSIGMNVKLPKEKLLEILEVTYERLYSQRSNKAQIMLVLTPVKDFLKSEINAGRITTVKQVVDVIEKRMKTTNESVTEARSTNIMGLIGSKGIGSLPQVEKIVDIRSQRDGMSALIRTTDGNAYEVQVRQAGDTQHPELQRFTESTDPADLTPMQQFLVVNNHLGVRIATGVKLFRNNPDAFQTIIDRHGFSDEEVSDAIDRMQMLHGEALAEASELMELTTGELEKQYRTDYEKERGRKVDEIYKRVYTLRYEQLLPLKQERKRLKRGHEFQHRGVVLKNGKAISPVMTAPSANEIREELIGFILSLNVGKDLPDTGAVTLFLNVDVATSVVGNNDDFYVKVTNIKGSPAIIVQPDPAPGFYRATDRNPVASRERGNTAVPATAVPARIAKAAGLKFARYVFGDQINKDGKTAFILVHHSDVADKSEKQRMFQPGVTVSPTKEIGEAKSDSKIRDRYNSLKKTSVKELRQIIGQKERGAIDLSGFDKQGAISHILRSEFGNKAVDAEFNLSESDQDFVVAGINGMCDPEECKDIIERYYNLGDFAEIMNDYPAQEVINELQSTGLMTHLIDYVNSEVGIPDSVSEEELVPYVLETVMDCLDVYLNEGRRQGSEYELYHDTYSNAINTAFEYHESSGLTVSEDDRWDYIAVGSKRPKPGDTTRLQVPATDQNGKRYKIFIQVYNRDQDRNTYELNTYADTHRDLQTEGAMGKAAAGVALAAALWGAAEVSSAKHTPLGQALQQAAEQGDTQAAEHLKKLDLYTDAGDLRTLEQLRAQYLSK